MKKANAAFGDKLVHEVTRHDVERLRAAEAARGMSVTTVGALLRDVRAVLQRAVQTDLVHRNVAVGVQAAGAPAKQRPFLSEEGFVAIRAHLVGHRNEFAWVMSLYGARRSEVLGLRWSDVDLDAETVTIARSRVPAPEKRANRRDPRTVVGDTKTERGRRTLPLWAPMLAAARRTRTLRQREHLALGIPWDEEAYLCVTEDDRRGPLDPMLPDRYSRLWGRLCDAAGVPRVPLHSARHGSVTRMRAAGMLDYEVAAWHGHDESIMRLVYSHTSTASLRAADPETESLRAAGEGL
jgi:integrase